MGIGHGQLLSGRRLGADGTDMARGKRCSVIDLLRKTTRGGLGEGVVEQSMKRR
jgi:hypothetical protein